MLLDLNQHYPYGRSRLKLNILCDWRCRVTPGFSVLGGLGLSYPKPIYLPIPFTGDGIPVF